MTSRHGNGVWRWDRMAIDIAAEIACITNIWWHSFAVCSLNVSLYSGWLGRSGHEKDLGWFRRSDHERVNDFGFSYIQACEWVKSRCDYKDLIDYCRWGGLHVDLS